MSYNEELKLKLEHQLSQAKHKMQLLDMKEDLLKQLKELAQYTLERDLNHEEMLEIHKQVNSLQEQIAVLDLECTAIS